MQDRTEQRRPAEVAGWLMWTFNRQPSPFTLAMQVFPVARPQEELRL